MLSRNRNMKTFSSRMTIGTITAFSAGMVNVISVIVFFAFTSNVTGHYAVLAQELSNGNFYQAAVVFCWISLFFFGNFISNLLIIKSNQGARFLSSSSPLILVILCLFGVGAYLELFYQQTLMETEILVGFMLLSMGLQNGYTASISDFAIKTSHLTGLTTDLALLLSMFTQKEFRSDKKLVERARLLIAILLSYLAGGIAAGIGYQEIGNYAFLIIGLSLTAIVLFDHLYLRIRNIQYQKPPLARKLVVN